MKIVDVKWYEWLYTIWEFGNVYNQKGLELKPSPDTKRGYLRVWLYKNWKRKEQPIHRLVAKHFVDWYNETVNHIDWNKLNNHYSNLEWLSNADNIRHSHKIWLRPKENMGQTKGKTFAISNEILLKLYKEHKAWISIRALWRKYWYNYATLSYAFRHNSYILDFIK